MRQGVVAIEVAGQRTKEYFFISETTIETKHKKIKGISVYFDWYKIIKNEAEEKSTHMMFFR